MDAITMPSKRLTLKQIQLDYPQFRFQSANVARWSPYENIVYYEPLRSANAKATLLHELGHALSNHSNYHQDIELLRYEREAWHIAKELAPEYGLDITSEHILEALRSYRHWLYRRSHCPTCDTPGIQTADIELKYNCLLCQTTWQANDARQCQLRRYIQPRTIKNTR